MAQWASEEIEVSGDNGRDINGDEWPMGRCDHREARGKHTSDVKSVAELHAISLAKQRAEQAQNDVRTPGGVAHRLVNDSMGMG